MCPGAGRAAANLSCTSGDRILNFRKTHCAHLHVAVGELGLRTTRADSAIAFPGFSTSADAPQLRPGKVGRGDDSLY
jgi:hypothetical protein